MAKGWESKSVESQIESAASHDGKDRVEVKLPPAAIEWIREKESLRLSLTRVQRELEDARNPRYRQILNKAYEDLSTKISALDERFASIVK